MTENQSTIAGHTDRVTGRPATIYTPPEDRVPVLTRLTDPAEIRATDEPDERGDSPCCTTPAPVSGAGLDLDAIEMNAWKYGARPPAHTVARMVSEIRNLRFAEQSSADAAHANYVAAESAEAEVVKLRAKVAAVEAKRDEFAELVARALPTIAALGAAEEVGDRWYGYGHGPNNIHPAESLPCDVCDVLREFRAALATTGEGQ